MIRITGRRIGFYDLGGQAAGGGVGIQTDLGIVREPQAEKCSVPVLHLGLPVLGEQIAFHLDVYAANFEAAADVDFFFAGFYVKTTAHAAAFGEEGAGGGSVQNRVVQQVDPDQILCSLPGGRPLDGGMAAGFLYDGPDFPGQAVVGDIGDAALQIGDAVVPLHNGQAGEVDCRRRPDEHQTQAGRDEPRPGQPGQTPPGGGLEVGLLDEVGGQLSHQVQNVLFFHRKPSFFSCSRSLFRARNSALLVLLTLHPRRRAVSSMLSPYQ